jgi:hypothetical protein
MELLVVGVEELIEMDVAVEDVEELTEAGVVRQGSGNRFVASEATDWAGGQAYSSSVDAWTAARLSNC